MEKNEFVETIGVLAQQVNNIMEKHVLPSICVAQACLESNYGQSGVMMKFNAPFGIKSSPSTQLAYNAKTAEYYNGQKTSENCFFRAYGSLYDAVKDYYNLLTTSSYYKNVVNDYNYLTAILGLTSYATDPLYITKVKNIIENENLTRFDTGIAIPVKVATWQTAYDVCMGRYGNGDERKKKLHDEGYNYEKVQSLVNSLVQTVKSIRLGTYGNGEERKARLGEVYCYAQDLVNRNMFI